MRTGTVVVVGAGAAGTMAALAARGVITTDGSVGAPPPGAPEVLLLDGQIEPGRKILISGGGRCNVTNAVVTHEDFDSTHPRIVRAALREFGVGPTRAFFTSIGVPLVEESLGKLFPTSGRARDVLDALRAAQRAAGVTTRFGTPVTAVQPAAGTGWTVEGVQADRVVVATGGLSIPATGSTGFGLDLARTGGHELVTPHPALAAMEGDGHPDEAGVALPVVLRVVQPDGRERRRAGGSMLFTHRGVSGPAALDVSVALEEARADGAPVGVVADLWTLSDPDGPMGPFLADPKLPGTCLADPPRAVDTRDLDAVLQDLDGARTIQQHLTGRLPRRIVDLVAGEDWDTPMSRLPRDARLRIATALSALPIRVDHTAGYAKAEVTSGGVRLDQLHRRTLESRLQPGLHFCGEVCDVTGRLGGFNFQWAWTSGVIAGRGAAAALAPSR